MAAFTTSYKSGKPGVYANLGFSFQELDSNIMETNEYQLQFYQRECQEYLDEYMLIDGNQLVKKVGGHTLLN